MNDIVLYSTNCPKCAILEGRLNEKGVKFTVNNDVDEMLRLGMMEAPGLMVDGKLMGFADAVKWANEQ